MSHLISDMGGESEGELFSVSSWELTAFDNVSRHPKLLGREDLLNAMAESGKRLQEGQSKMSEHEVLWKCEDSHLHSELGTERHELVWILARPMGHRSRIQIAVVTSGREAKWRIGIAGVARSLARVLSTNVLVVGCTTCLRNHGHEAPFETCDVSRCLSNFSHPVDCEW